MYFTVKDPYRQAIEAASGGRNTVMYDDKGYPSVLVCVPKFNMEDVASDIGTGRSPHGERELKHSRSAGSTIVNEVALRMESVN